MGGGFPLPIITHAPSLVTSSIVRKIVAGPGGYTLPFGGVVNVSDLPSEEIRASMNTNRALEWNAWDENPRSMSDTARSAVSEAPTITTPYAYLGPSAPGG